MPMLTERRSDSSEVLTEAMAERLRPSLPGLLKLVSTWKLIYSLDQHGISLTTLYRRARANEGPCILAMKDSQDNVFGAYLSNYLRPSDRYYGTGQCFLWKAVSKDPKDVENFDLKIFEWTGRNEYMILPDTEFIAVGGGDGKFGLWIDAALENGYSTTCPTFNNEQLSSQPEFTCSGLEVWGFNKL